MEIEIAEENILIIDESSSIIKVDLPFGEAIVSSEITISNLKESEIRTMMTRFRQLLELERKQSERREQVEDIGILEQMERAYHTQRAFTAQAMAGIFLNDATKLKEVIEDENGHVMTKNELVHWLSGDFILAWGRMFFYMFEIARTHLKKKLG
jgi:hypothetical protein